MGPCTAFFAHTEAGGACYGEEVSWLAAVALAGLVVEPAPTEPPSVTPTAVQPAPTQEPKSEVVTLAPPDTDTDSSEASVPAAPVAPVPVQRTNPRPDGAGLFDPWAAPIQSVVPRHPAAPRTLSLTPRAATTPTVVATPAPTRARSSLDAPLLDPWSHPRRTTVTPPVEPDLRHPFTASAKGSASRLARADLREPFGRPSQAEAAAAVSPHPRPLTTEDVELRDPFGRRPAASSSSHCRTGDSPSADDAAAPRPPCLPVSPPAQAAPAPVETESTPPPSEAPEQPPRADPSA